MMERIDFDSLMKQALRCGIDVSTFWQMTPRETYMAIDACIWRNEQEYEHMLRLAWHTAAMTRTKRLPSLKSLLTRASKPKKLTGKELKQRRKEFQEMKTRVDLTKINAKRRKNE